MAHAARSMRMVFDEEPKKFRPTHIIRDRDTKFTTRFCPILEAGESVDDFRLENVVCRDSLGGLLKHYERRAA